MRIDVRVTAILKDPTGERLLLLRRDPSKKLLPNMITGIGGALEFTLREHEDATRALKRELGEEVPQIDVESIRDLRLRMVTHESRGDHVVMLLWYSGTLGAEVTDLTCSEGTLEWFDSEHLPHDEMTPAAREVIPFVADLPDDDMDVHDAVYHVGNQGRLIM